MRCNLIAWAAVALIGAAPFATARADVLFDNTGQFSPSGGYFGSGLYDPIASAANGGGGPIALSFSTGSQGVFLSSVTFALQGSNDLGGISVSLWSNDPIGSSTSTPAPGTEIASLATINDSALPTSFNLVTVSVASQITLNASTRYWVELADAGLSSTVSSALWAYDAQAPLGSGLGVASEYNWNNYSVGAGLNSTALNTVAGTDFMQVEAVPEPASFGLLALGLAGLAFARRKRAV